MSPVSRPDRLLPLRSQRPDDGPDDNTRTRAGWPAMQRPLSAGSPA